MAWRALRFLGLVLVLGTGLLRGGSETVEWLVSPSVASGSLVLVLCGFNAATTASAAFLPSGVSCRLTSAAGGAWTLELVQAAPSAGSIVVPGRGFHRAEYRGPLPAGAQGMLRGEVVGVQAPPFLLPPPDGSPGVPALPAAAAGAGMSPGLPVAPVPAPALRDYFRNFSAREPVYFAVGLGEKLDAKFQVSLKYAIFGTSRSGLCRDLYFGYSQTSLWDVETDSAPFHDTSYRPALLYYRQGTEREGALSRIDIEAGYEHESNGKAGSDSRSVNIVYVKPSFRFGDPDRLALTIAPRLYAYTGKSDNPDIPQYRGYCDLGLALEDHHRGWLLSATLRKGTRGSYGSAEVALAYPMRRILPSAPEADILLQYFSGYGEGILDYDQRFDPQLRIGVQLVR